MAALVILALPARGQFEVVPQEPLETSDYYIAARPNYASSDWIFDQTNCMSSAEMGILGGRISGESRPQMMVLGCFGLSPYAA